MKSFITLTALALAPFAAFAHEGHDHDHEHEEAANPRVALNATQRANLRLATVKAAPGKIGRTVFALGEITGDPRGESAASSRIPGRVVELKVALGDKVKAGDTLAVVEARQSGGAEPARVKIVALADGTVVDVLTRLGEPVSPDAPLLRLADRTRLIAEAHIPQTHAASLKPGVTRVRMTPEGGETREVTLGGFLPSADPVAGTLLARFDIDNKAGEFVPGRRVEFRVILSEKEYPVVIPRDAVQGERGDLFVFVEEHPGVYEKHPVVVVDGDDRSVAITGPEAGEAVVTRGAYSLSYSDASNVSLQEALDAAHGHKHGPNGEEPGTPGGPPAEAGAAHTHDHAHDHADPDHDDDDHDHDHDHAKPGATPAAGATAHTHSHDEAGAKPAAGKNATAKPASGNAALKAELDAAHGHAHGPNGEELDEHAAKATPGFFSGDSGAFFFGTIAAGEAVLLLLAVTALHRRRDKEPSDA